MIKQLSADHGVRVTTLALGSSHTGESEQVEPAQLCLDQIVRDHFQFVWRMLRRLGLSDADADDAAQRVFLITSRKLEQIEPEKLRSFLFGVTRRVARDLRKQNGARPQTVDMDAHPLVDPTPLPDEAEELRRRRVWLDMVLSQLDEPLRLVLVLADIDEIPMREIADMLEIPAGTVASRLRRARVLFAEHGSRLRANLTRGAT